VCLDGRSVVLFLFMTRRRRHAATTPARKSRSSRRGRQRAGAADPDPPGYHVAPRYCVTLWTRAPAAECDVMETKRAECTKVASSLRLRITFFCYIWRFIIFYIVLYLLSLSQVLWSRTRQNGTYTRPTQGCHFE